MIESVTIPLGAGKRPLLPGDRVVYTSRSRLYQGILMKTNVYKSMIQETNENWEPIVKGYRTQTLIDNAKIFKTNE